MGMTKVMIPMIFMIAPGGHVHGNHHVHGCHLHGVQGFP